MDAGCAGRAPLGKWRTTAIPWREEGSELSAPGRTRHDTARGGTGHSRAWPGHRGHSGARPKPLREGPGGTGQPGLGTPTAQDSSHREQAWGLSQHGTAATENKAWGLSQQPRAVGREVAEPRGAAPRPRAPLRTAQWPERLHGHRQSRAVWGQNHARAPLGDTRGPDSGAQGHSRHGGVPGPAGLNLPPAVAHSTVSTHDDPGPRCSRLASRALPGAGESLWGRDGAGWGGAARSLHVGGPAVAAHAAPAPRGRSRPSSPFPERSIPNTAELSPSCTAYQHSPRPAAPSRRLCPRVE